jgi:hypothetical protein
MGEGATNRNRLGFLRFPPHLPLCFNRHLARGGRLG